MKPVMMPVRLGRGIKIHKGLGAATMCNARGGTNVRVLSLEEAKSSSLEWCRKCWKDVPDAEELNRLYESYKKWQNQ